MSQTVAIVLPLPVALALVVLLLVLLVLSAVALSLRAAPPDHGSPGGEGQRAGQDDSDALEAVAPAPFRRR